MMDMMKPCPFCGKPVDISDPDTLHPSGFGWKEECGIRSYHSIKDGPVQLCWEINCPVTSGGCGANIIADSRAEVVDLWNKRK